MLNALYGTFFGRLDPRRSEPVSVVIGLVVLTVLAFNAAATTDTGIGGVLGFGCLFFYAGLLGWLWLGALLHLFAQLQGGPGTARQTMGAVMSGLWPLMLSAPAIAAANWAPSLSLVLNLGVIGGTLLSLSRGLQQIHQWDWPRSLINVLLALATTCLALLSVIPALLLLFLGL